MLRFCRVALFRITFQRFTPILLGINYVIRSHNSINQRRRGETRSKGKNTMEKLENSGLNPCIFLETEICTM